MAYRHPLRRTLIVNQRYLQDLDNRLTEKAILPSDTPRRFPTKVLMAAERPVKAGWNF
jgi:hypothetical protein